MIATDPVVETWLAECTRHPGQLPAGFEMVQARLVRAVGRGEHPELGTVYAKVMGFPRFRDRLRYIHRDLPAIHEAKMIERVHAVGVDASQVVAASGCRRFGVPQVSVLITRALDGDEVVAWPAAVDVAARLADHGVFHPDLNRGNFIGLRGGGVAVLDLQSARATDRSLSRDRRRRMAAKLLLEFGADADLDTIGAAGLVALDELSAVQADTERLAAEAFDRRVGRCLTTSTDFVVERHWFGKLHRRRAHPVAIGDCVPHPRARELWIGDRACELQAGTAPILAAMFQKAWWFPGRNSAKIALSDGRKLSAVDERRLHEAFMHLSNVGTTSAASSRD